MPEKALPDRRFFYMEDNIMKDFSVVMALVDFIPVLLFAVAAVILMRDLYNKMSKGAFALFAAGAIDIVCAGALKALYKLLYAAGVCDFEPLNAMFFPVQSIGFLLAGVGILAMICHRQTPKKVYSVTAAAVPVFTGTFIFVGFMCGGLGLITVGLSYLSAKLKKGWVMAIFIFAFFCCVGMGYLSSRDFTQASMNWIAQGVNIAGQGAFLAGTLLLHKFGLAELKLRTGRAND